MPPAKLIHQKNNDVSAALGPSLMGTNSAPDKSAKFKIIFLFRNQNICCGYLKEPFEHPKYMLKMIGKKIVAILCSIFFFFFLILNFFFIFVFFLYSKFLLTQHICQTQNFC